MSGAIMQCLTFVTFIVFYKNRNVHIFDTPGRPSTDHYILILFHMNQEEEEEQRLRWLYVNYKTRKRHLSLLNTNQRHIKLIVHDLCNVCMIRMSWLENHVD